MEIAGLAGRLANPNFAGKAPPEVVAECQAYLADVGPRRRWCGGGWRSWAEVGAAESEP